ncbi:MAG: ACP S-malonyltransferase [Proteobacteria bacterium]|nr:ACP S-malonyltransferase [Pseudomonadota bacterium]
MLSLAMFPGQGSQLVGMGKDVLSEFPYTEKIYEEAEDTVHLPLRKLCFEGPQEKLNQTCYAQPCVLVTSVAIWHVLQQETSFQAAYFAGHSLGEYTALVASGKVGLATATDLVYKRGKAMQEAFCADRAAMLALLGPVDHKKLEDLCSKITQECRDGEGDHDDMVAIANINASQQVVVSGSQLAAAKLKASMAKELGPSIRSIFLSVSAPFHCSLMSPARKALADTLYNTSIAHSPYQLISNVTGLLEVPYTPKLLVEQIDAPVMWLKTYHTAQSLGVERLVEVGAGNVLSKMWRKEPGYSSLQVHNTSHLRDVLPVLQK